MPRHFAKKMNIFSYPKDYEQFVPLEMAFKLFTSFGPRGVPTDFRVQKQYGWPPRLYFKQFGKYWVNRDYHLQPIPSGPDFDKFVFHYKDGQEHQGPEPEPKPVFE